MRFPNPFRRLRSAEPPEFQEFLLRQSAFVAQKTVLDYCRVKAGRNEKAHFADPDFQAALQHCRWQVFLAAAADVWLLAESALRPHAQAREALAEGLAAMHDSALDATPPPPEEACAHAQARAALRHHLAAAQAGPPEAAHLRPLLSEPVLFATLPVHPDQRKGEAPAIRGGLRFHVVSTQQEMEKRFDLPALATRISQENVKYN